tara:strand:+ start:229 stop:435 length:207 start_codon:yes stop_codon:yes gene_type:complete
MNKLKSPNSNYIVFLLLVIADVFLLYNLVQYIRYGLDTYWNGFIASLVVGIILLIYLWKNNFFAQNKS